MAYAPTTKVFFHVGLGKTGTKFLQHSFFPRLPLILYIKPQRFKRYPKLAEILNTTPTPPEKVLFSRELDQQFERVVREFARTFPDAGTIIVFRRHDEWILSQYKRHIKNGYNITFSEFFNLRNTGLFKLRDLDFSGKVALLQELFTMPPLVLLYDELCTDPSKFLKKIAIYLGVPLPGKYSLRRRHTSYSEKQLRFAYLASSVLNWRPVDNVLIRYLYVYPIRYGVLALGALLPGRLTASVKVLPPQEVLQEIREFFNEDWERCVALAVYSEKQLTTKEQ